MAFIENLLLFIRGYRKLLVALITIVVVILIFTVSLALLIKSIITGAEFVEVVKIIAPVVSTVVVAYMGTNMGKHLLDAGKEMFQNYITTKKKK